MTKIALNKSYTVWSSGTYSMKALLEYNWRVRKTNRFIFMDGKPVPVEDYDLILDSEVTEDKLTKYDILPNLSGSPIVNQKVIDVLKEICPNDFQAFPAIFRNKDNSISSFENKDYFLINITKLVEVIDMEKSDVDLYESGNISSIRRLTFKEGGMGGVHLAREARTHSMELASGTLVQAFKKAKIKGVSFKTYDGGRYP
jgi:hypothetical protein